MRGGFGPPAGVYPPTRSRRCCRGSHRSGSRRPRRHRPGFELVSDPDAFERVVGNLIGNALEYGSPPVLVRGRERRHFRSTSRSRPRACRGSSCRTFERFTRASETRGGAGRARSRDRARVCRRGRRGARLRASGAAGRAFVFAVLGSNRELDRGSRATTAVRGDPDAAVHAMHELAADVEAEACSADAAGQVRVEAEELLEDPRLLGRRDAEALVDDAEPDVVAGLRRARPGRCRRRASTSPRCRAGSSVPGGACRGRPRPAAARPATTTSSTWVGDARAARSGTLPVSSRHHS